MANFAVAASQETIEFANKIMELYAQDGDKKEDTLLRIFNLAESESVKGTHPELEETLKSVDSTIVTLIKQINGIVSGQDFQIKDLKERLENAIIEKNAAMLEAKTRLDEAQALTETANAAIRQASEDIENAEKRANAEIESAKKEAAISIERANTERDQAIRERDDARTISAEKTASNDLLMRQMASMESEAVAAKELKVKYEKMQSEYNELKGSNAELERTLAKQKTDLEARIDQNKAQADRDLKECQKDAKHSEDLLNAKLTRAESDFSSLQKDYEKLASKNSELGEQVKELNEKLIRTSGDTELSIERAVIAKEREMQALLRQADKENARLQARIEQLQNTAK